MKALPADLQVNRALIVLLWRCPSDRREGGFYLLKIPTAGPMLRSAGTWSLASARPLWGLVLSRASQGPAVR